MTTPSQAPGAEEAPSRPPWSAEQVDKLREWQSCGWVHPFTCPDHGDKAHQRYREETGSPDALLADEHGWICEWCGYTQDWAHAFMLDGAPPHPLAAFDAARTEQVSPPIREDQNDV
jgi:hypothetical protein